MSEETTQNLGGREQFEALVLAELRFINSRLTSRESRPAAVEGRLTTLEGRVDGLDKRLTSLEEKVDSRLNETRPIWEAVPSRLDIIESKVEALALGMVGMRGDLGRVKKRIPPAA